MGISALIYVLWCYLGFCAFIFEQKGREGLSIFCYVVFFSFIPLFPFVWHASGVF